MVVAFLLLGCRTGREAAVLDEIERIESVVYAQPLFGEHDLIVKVEAGDLQDLSSIVLERIRSIEGVVTTKTLTCAHF